MTLFLILGLSALALMARQIAVSNQRQWVPIRIRVEAPARSPHASR